MERLKALIAFLCLIYGGKAVVVTKENLEDIEVDPNGYMMFCPCMGRFGNQADHYLGSLAFAKGINRTLVLPPWVEYQPQLRRSVQVPFKKYFDAEAVKKYHRVIPMENFFSSKKLSNTIWPESKRKSFCHSKRQGLPGEREHKGGACYAKSGNPFESFWDTYNIDFVGSELYGNAGLNYDVSYPQSIEAWQRNYPASKWPVIAFTGAPAPFPVRKYHLHLHQYLFNWNEEFNEMAENFISNHLPQGPFVGIHLRNGIDFARACDLVKDTKQLFSSAQCLGYFNEHGQATKEMCSPSENEIYTKVESAVKSVQALSVFVASDNDHMIDRLQKHLKRTVTNFKKVVKLNSDNSHLDLAIMGRSSVFVGNCVSSFSAFVKRERDVKELPTMFFGFPNKKHDEL